MDGKSSPQLPKVQPTKITTTEGTILHKTLTVNGITMHVAEKGDNSDDRPIILFLHGFPETWYTWRHQLNTFSSLGYRAIAPDLRGFGETEAPVSPSDYTCHHVVGDLLALMDSLGVDRFYLVAHDWGALIGWYLCMFRPDRVLAYVCLTVPFRPRNPKMKPVDAMRAYFGDDYYMCRFQKPGDIESEIEQVGARNVIKLILINRKPGPQMLPKGKSFLIPPDMKIPLPSWLSEEDIDCLSQSFEKKGFTAGLNYYRAMDLNWELTAAWTDVQIKVPVKFIVGDLDMTYTTPGVKEYVHGDGFKKDVPFLEDVVVMEGVGHFINQEKPQEINTHIHDFIKNYCQYFHVL